MTLRVPEYLAYIASPLRRHTALPSTVLTYDKTLRLFERWLGERPATPETAQEWLESLVAAGRQTSYISKVASCVQSYLQWALKDKEVFLEYHRGIDLRPPNFYYSFEEVERFVDALWGAPRCCLAIQFDTGLRISSVLSIRLAYVDPQSGKTVSDIALDDDPPSVAAYAKGGHQTRKRLTHYGVDAVRRWLLESTVDRRQRASATDRHLLFLDWQYRDVYDAYKEAAASVGMAFHGTHALRHTAAVWQLQHGATLKDVSEMLDHRNINTTAKIYTPLALRELSERLATPPVRRGRG